MTIISILFVVAIVATFSLGIAFILDTQASNMRWQRRALYAALGGAFIPLLLPIITIAMMEGISAETAIAILGLVIGGLILAALVGFPLAYWFCKRRELARNPANPAKAFE